MLINKEDFKKYLDARFFHSNIISLHDAIIESINLCKEYVEIKVNAYEWDKCSYVLKFYNPNSFHFSTGTDDLINYNESYLFKTEFLTYILFFNLIEFKNDIYFYFLIGDNMNTLLFKADSFSFDKCD